MPSANLTAPDDAALDAVFARAVRARFCQHPLCVEPEGAEPRTLLEVGPDELASLREVMRLAPGPGPHCMCVGDMQLALEDAAGESLASITLHHGYTLRWKGAWEWSDAAFADPNALMEWLAARGVRDYVEQRDRAALAQREHASERERWLAAAPACLRERLPTLESDSMGVPRRLSDAELDAALDSLRSELGSDTEVAWRLLAWFGRGAGPWSGYPAYESVPESLLLRLGTDVVLRAVDGRELAEALLSGLARYCGSYELHRSRRSDTQKVPPQLRERLLAHVRAIEIGDNLQRLEAGFRAPDRPALRGDGSGVVCVHPDRAISEVVTNNEKIFAIEPRGVVRFDPGNETPVPLLEQERFYASLAVDDSHVYAALINEGTILKLPHAGGQPIVLAQDRGRPLWLTLRDGWLGWIDQPWVPDPVRGPPFSITRTTVCALCTEGGAVREIAIHDSGGWDLAISGDRVAWVHQSNARPTIASVNTTGGEISTWPVELDGQLDGFVHLASEGEHLIVAVPTKSWLRKGVELRRYTTDGRLLAKIEFVPGEYRGLTANEFGIALVVDRKSSLLAIWWDPAGESAKLKVPRELGPQIKPHLAADGLYFAVASKIYRMTRS